MNTEEVRCPICNSNDTTNITIRDFDGNAHFHSSDLYLNYICGCMKCGVVFIPRQILPKEEAID